MQDCDFPSWLSAVDTLKKDGSIKVSNFFLDINETQDLLAKNACKIIIGPAGTLFLLKPWHNGGFDIYYQSHKLENLSEDIKVLPHHLPLHVSIIGKEPLAGQIAKQFTQTSFELRKKLLRMLCKSPTESLIKALEVFAKPFADNFDFARPEEAEEIFDILAADFDPSADNLPLLSEIREAAANKWVPVIRLDGKIAALHYFTLRQNILNGLYDVTRKEYRGSDGLFPALKYYVDKHVPKIHPGIKRAYGWRDCTNKKLIKNAKSLNQNKDGVMIYNMFRPVIS